MVPSLGFRVSGCGFRVEGEGFRTQLHKVDCIVQGYFAQKKRRPPRTL